MTTLCEVVVDDWNVEKVVQRNRRSTDALRTARILAKARLPNGHPVYASVEVWRDGKRLFECDNTPSV
jgi:hypothetical protein